MDKSLMKNKDCGRKGVPLNINKEGTVHTNPDGSTVEVLVVTNDMYFNKRKKSTSAGSSWAFPNHVEFNGWLYMNDLVNVDIEETEEFGAV